MKTDAIEECLSLAADYNGEADERAQEAWRQLKAILDRLKELECYSSAQVERIFNKNSMPDNSNYNIQP